MNSNIKPGEIWHGKLPLPNDSQKTKSRPVFIIGNDKLNNLIYCDIQYAIIYSSAKCGIYDVEIDEEMAKRIGLERKSVIKTTKIYTFSEDMFKEKIGNLPIEKLEEFLKKYKEYQNGLFNSLEKIKIENIF